MLIPKANRVKIYSYLFQEGVIVAADDKNARAHMEVSDVPNLQVMKLMESLTSRGYVRHSYTWKHHYWFLTNEGIQHLREYLNLPEMIVPNTHKKQQTRTASRPLGGEERGPGGGRYGSGPGDRPGGFGRGRGGDREGYRSGPGKEPSSFGDRPSFGRGRDGPRFGGRGGAPTPQ